MEILVKMKQAAFSQDIYIPKTIKDLNNNCDSKLNVAIDYLVQQAELTNENIDDD